MENSNTSYKTVSEKPHLSVSLCGQLGVKKNFLQRAFGKEWNADKGKRYNKGSDSGIPKDGRSKSPIKETNKENEKTPVRSKVSVESYSPHQSNSCADKTSCDQLMAISKGDCEDEHRNTMSGQHRLSDTSKAVVVSPLVTKKGENKSDDKKMQECSGLQFKILSQCQPLAQQSKVSCASRKVLTPLKNQMSEIRNERTSYQITPPTKHLQIGSHSANKRIDTSVVSSVFSVKRRIFSHDDKENQLPHCTQDLIPTQIRARETNSSPLCKLKSLSQETPTKQLEFPEVHHPSPGERCKNVTKQNFSKTVKQLTSQELSSNQMSMPVAVPKACQSSCIIKCHEDDEIKETKLDLDVDDEDMDITPASEYKNCRSRSHTPPQGRGATSSTSKSPSRKKTIRGLKASSVLTKPSTSAAHHLAIANASIGRSVDCLLTPAYKQAVVTVKQTSSSIHLPINLIQDHVSKAPAEYVKNNEEKQYLKPERDSVSSNEHGDESDASSSHLEHKCSLIDSSSGRKSSLPDTILDSSSPNKDNVNHLHSSKPNPGSPDPVSDATGQKSDSDNNKNQEAIMSQYTYPQVFGSPPGNLPLEMIRQLQLSSHGVGSQVAPMTTSAAVGVPSIHTPLGVLFNQGQVPMRSSTPTRSFLSPYIRPIIRPQYTSTPGSSSVNSKDWQQNLRPPFPITSHIRPMFSPPLNSSSVDSKEWQQKFRLPAAATSQSSYQHQGLHLLAPTGQSPHPVNFIAPSMIPYAVFPQGHRFLTPTPYAAVRPVENASTEQNLPLDLSGMASKVEPAGSSEPNQCRRTLFPPSRSNGLTLPPSQRARLSADGAFNSSGDSAYKSDEDRRTPDSQIATNDQSSGRDTGGSNNIKNEEKNPFGIHKILGVQKSPVKPTKIRNHDGYCEFMMLPTAGTKAPEGAVRRPVKRRLSTCDNTDEDPPSAKKKCRDKPPMWGTEMPVPPIHFEESEERKLFCDADLSYQVPEVPEEYDEQEKLRLALLRLFEKSDLPPVPHQLKENLFGLRFFPRMSTIYQARLSFDVRKLNMSPSGLAFENFRIEENNSMVDQMLRKEGDVYHCLGRKCVDPVNATCSFTAKTLGKMRRHVKNHLPDKKWVCCFCRAQMTDQTDMSRHGTTHTMLRPFFCDPCGKNFTQKVTLVNHLRTNHSMTEEEEDTKDRYTCRQCGVHYKSSQRQECVEHLRKFHYQTSYVSLKKRNRFPFNNEEAL